MEMNILTIDTRIILKRNAPSENVRVRELLREIEEEG